jgi:RimJ/RimL family protein N-acetyltransferase
VRTRVKSAVITTGRLSLVPLSVDDAEEMAAVLDDERLHEFTGGRPLTLDELRDRYARLVAGSSKADEVWLNWIVRLRADSQPVGTVQATLTADGDHWTAHVAWVIGADFHNQGFASEAARALVEWLREQGVEDIAANVHRDHRASGIVATRAGSNRPTTR